jgi:hypothetical protein
VYGSENKLNSLLLLLLFNLTINCHRSALGLIAEISGTKMKRSHVRLLIS